MRTDFDPVPRRMLFSTRAMGHDPMFLKAPQPRLLNPPELGRELQQERLWSSKAALKSTGLGAGRGTGVGVGTDVSILAVVSTGAGVTAPVSPQVAATLAALASGAGPAA